MLNFLFLNLTFESKFENSHKKNFRRPYPNFGSAFHIPQFQLAGRFYWDGVSSHHWWKNAWLRLGLGPIWRWAFRSCNLPRSGCTSRWIHRKKRFTSFLSPAGMSLTKLPLGSYDDIIPAQGEFGSDIPAVGTGNSRTFFLRCKETLVTSRHTASPEH